jgi:hypothetical protein
MQGDNRMKHIHIVGAGGNAGQLAYRCLKDHYNVTGHDEGPWGEKIMSCEYGEGPWYADMILPLPDKAVASRYGDSDLSFTPDKKQIALCQDKAKCAEVLGDLAPITYWVRDTQGAGGKGAQMASEYLPGRNISVELCYWEDYVVGYFIKERLAYSISGSKEPTHQFGTSFVSKCIYDENILVSAYIGLGKISEETGTKLHGFYGIDFKEGDNGFKITEINAGRLLTASYCYYYLTNYNLLRAGVAKFLGEKYELGEYPLGYGIIRGMDIEPKLFTPNQTKEWK